MMLRFMPTGWAPQNYTITGETINTVDLSVIEHGGQWIGDEATQAAGIVHAERDADGELWVTLSQATLGYQIPVPSSDWREGDWMDADDYEPDTCYVVPTSIPEGVVHELAWITRTMQTPSGEISDSGWTVLPVVEEEDE